MRRWPVLLALGALLGCDDPVKIANVDRQTPYSAGLVRFAAKTGELAASIHGNPFPVPLEPEQIVAAIGLPGWLPRGTRLTTRPGPGTAANIRVVLAFNPAWRGVREDWLCDAQARLDLAPAADRTVVAAALCVDGKPVSWLHGEGRPAASPAAKSFHNLMDQVMANLLPNRDEAN